MAFHPYLNFDGNCREAFTRYHQIFGGQLDVLSLDDIPEEDRAGLPPEAQDMVMHAALTIGDHLLMGSDDPTGGYAPPCSMHVNFSTPDAAEAERVWKELSDGAQVVMPFGATFWSPGFGMCTDTFGTPWMVNVEADMPT